MQEWWENLSGAESFFYGMAIFSSVFFIWQILAAFMGLDGDADVDIADSDIPDTIDHVDVLESSQAFKLLSLRSIVTFFTLFSWGSAMYLSEGMSVIKAMSISSIWGLGGMVAIALIFYGMGKMAETGTKDLLRAQGTIGTVYLNIPENGFGEVKLEINGAVEHVKAKSINAEALVAGTQIRVVNVVSQTLLEVEKLTNKGE